MKEKKEEAKDVKERGRNIAALFDLDGTLVARPSLDDVYLRYAGRRFETTDTATQSEARR